MANHNQRYAVLPLLLILAIATLTALFIWIKSYLLATPCFIYKQTDIQCPGCGGTRAIHSLTQGNLTAAFQYNALLSLIALSIPLLLISSSFFQLIKGRPLFPQFKHWINLRSGLVLIVIIVIFTLWRNLIA